MLGLVFTVVLSTAADPIAGSDLEFGLKLCRGFAESESTTSKLIAQLREKHAGDKTFLGALAAAQKAFRKFRVTMLKLQYPAKDARKAYGSSYEGCRCESMKRMTDAWLENLKRWREGVPQGEICAGTIPHTK